MSAKIQLLLALGMCLAVVSACTTNAPNSNDASEIDCTGTATYQVTFTATWSEQTHDVLPSNPHFSGLIGATHDSAVTLWASGELATDGIENMAEMGSKSPLDDEISALISSGNAGTTLSGGGINPSPGSVNLSFEISPNHPLVSLVSMLAPSPDWFVGVRDLSLCEDGTWIETVEVELFVYDAGTDSGATFTAANQDTDPAEVIKLFDDALFVVNGELVPVGTFSFVRQ